MNHNSVFFHTIHCIFFNESIVTCNQLIWYDMIWMSVLPTRYCMHAVSDHAMMMMMMMMELNVYTYPIHHHHVMIHLCTTVHARNLVLSRWVDSSMIFYSYSCYYVQESFYLEWQTNKEYSRTRTRTRRRNVWSIHPVYPLTDSFLVSILVQATDTNW